MAQVFAVMGLVFGALAGVALGLLLASVAPLDLDLTLLAQYTEGMANARAFVHCLGFGLAGAATGALVGVLSGSVLEKVVRAMVAVTVALVIGLGVMAAAAYVLLGAA